MSETKSFYGETAEEWLRRWDAGETVWSCEMGGIGPGYEQCIQILAAEVVRAMIAIRADTDEWRYERKWKVQREKIESATGFRSAVEKIGPTGAQVGAALNLASILYRYGPDAVLSDEENGAPKIPKDSRIQVCKNFQEGE